MAPDNSSAQEKTEEASPRRREEARKKGQVAKSIELNASLNLLGIVVILIALQTYYTQNFHAYFTNYFSHALHVKDADLLVMLLEAINMYFRLIWPIFLGAFLIALISNLAQVGFVFSGEAIKPKLEKINPISGLKRIFSQKTLVELIKNILKTVLITTVIVIAIKKRFPEFLTVSDMEIGQLLFFGGQVLTSIAVTVIITYMIIAILDYSYQKYEFNKSLRMSKQEVKEEFKQTEGDPHIKSKIKEKQRQMASRRMMQEVPTSTVVITNPTHFAVGIKYEHRETDAPMVVAKGVDLIAGKIKELALENNVPLVENKPVAQFLYRNVEIGEYIPEELYQAMAEILAVVYQKRKKIL